MTLTIIINDGFERYKAYQATGVLNNPSRRVVTISLTEDQMKVIGLKQTEDIESISTKL